MTGPIHRLLCVVLLALSPNSGAAQAGPAADEILREAYAAVGCQVAAADRWLFTRFIAAKAAGARVRPVTPAEAHGIIAAERFAQVPQMPDGAALLAAAHEVLMLDALWRSTGEVFANQDRSLELFGCSPVGTPSALDPYRL